jgi:hypothetical protein
VPTRPLWQLLAQSGHSRHRNILSAIGVLADIGPGSPAPMTLSNMRANGVWTLAAWCRASAVHFYGHLTYPIQESALSTMREAKSMLFVALLMLAATGLFYVAATFQNHGYAWADQTCTGMPLLCASPHIVAIGAVAAVAVFFVMERIRS